MKKLIFLFAAFFFFAALPLHAAEVKNLKSRQAGNRVQLDYDLPGNEAEAEVEVMFTIGGKQYKASELHLEGDYGKVKPGGRKTIYWNVLRDFPRGLNTNVVFDVTAGGFINHYMEQDDKWKVRINIKSLNKGERSGSIDFRSLNCGGYLNYIDKQDEGHLFKENLNYGNCVKGCYIWLNNEGTFYKEICTNKVTGSGNLRYAE